MTLKTMLDVLGETRYRITACEVNTGEYETIEIDYDGDLTKFGESLTIRTMWTARKNRVEYVRYNKAAGCIEIRVDLLD